MTPPAGAGGGSERRDYLVVSPSTTRGTPTSRHLPRIVGPEAEFPPLRPRRWYLERVSGRVLTSLLVAATLAPSVVLASDDWLPAPVRDGLVHQLAERLTTTAVGDHDIGRVTESARSVVIAIEDILDRRGVSGTIEAAPTFPDLEIPHSGSPLLDAMARYQVCNLTLVLRLQEPALNDDVNARLATVFEMTAITTAVVHLRKPFVEGGGEPAAIEAHLAGPALEPALAAIQADLRMRSDVDARCRPAARALLDEPLSLLTSSPGA